MLQSSKYWNYKHVCHAHLKYLFLTRFRLQNSFWKIFVWLWDRVSCSPFWFCSLCSWGWPITYWSSCFSPSQMLGLQVHKTWQITVHIYAVELFRTSFWVMKLKCIFFPSIDCAGILKLRNSDIELRKGETDIGRKNTRVRLVFRVHIPQPSGKVLSLQIASIPVECCKWACNMFLMYAIWFWCKFCVFWLKWDIY